MRTEAIFPKNQELGQALAYLRMTIFGILKSCSHVVLVIGKYMMGSQTVKIHHSCSQNFPTAEPGIIKVNGAI